jgi:hypothetical protein
LLWLDAVIIDGSAPLLVWRIWADLRADQRDPVRPLR